jgi:hypothetical protein
MLPHFDGVVKRIEVFFYLQYTLEVARCPHHKKLAGLLVKPQLGVPWMSVYESDIADRTRIAQSVRVFQNNQCVASEKVIVNL